MPSSGMTRSGSSLTCTVSRDGGTRRAMVWRVVSMSASIVVRQGESSGAYAGQSIVQSAMTAFGDRVRGMSRTSIPSEFDDLLSRAGRRVLAGTYPLCGALADTRRRFLAVDDLIDRTKAARLRRELEEKLSATLEPMDRPIPPESIWGMRHDYEERLPKTSRARTVYFESRREAGAKAAERIGLVRLMRSASFRAFAEALAGRTLASGWGLQ